jgi:hypothetical protein
LQFDIADLPALVEMLVAAGYMPAAKSIAPIEATVLSETVASVDDSTDAEPAPAPSNPNRKEQLRRLRSHPEFLKAGIARGLVEVLAERPDEYIDLSEGMKRQKERGYPTTSSGWDMRRYFTASSELGIYDQGTDVDSLIGYRKTRGGWVQRKMSRADATIWRELNEEEN